MPNYILKTVKADGSAYGDFVWPLEVGAQVVAPDFNTDASCGGGLHGLLNGCGNGALLNWGDGAVWIVAKVPKKAQMVDLGDKVKVDRCKIVHVGNRETATTFLVDHGCSGPIVGVTATAGDGGTATAGYRGTAIAGDGGTATAANRGTIILTWWDDENDRRRTTIGYVGEDGIEANVAYRLNENGKLVKA